MNEDQLFKEWIQFYQKNEIVGFVKDGIVNPSVWKNEKTKIVFLFKEWNDPHKANDDMRTFLQKGARYSANTKEPTFNNITKWIKGITEECSYEEVGKINLEECIKQVNKVSCINIKKEPGSAQAVPNELVFAAKRDYEYLYKQLKMYTDADVFITCGKIVGDIVIHNVNSFDNPWYKSSVGELFKVNNRNQIFISFYHPNSRHLSSKTLFEKLLITYQEAKALRS